ncbi:MAG: DEAD/DEAH box helicase, partial [Nanoarchaeota archaeon]
MGDINFKNKPDTREALEKILNPYIKKWFFSKFNDFSESQRYAVIDIQSRKNILISAPTGATKTLTAFLAIINELFDSASKGVLEDKIYCVYVSPLKALNNDIKRNLLEPLEEIEKIYGRELGIRVDVRTGDTTTKERSNQLKKPPHILITTPESLGIILNSPRFRQHLSRVDWFIADEIHALSDNKRGVHLSLSMERLAHLSHHMARIGLSATIAPLEEIAKYLAGARDCSVVDVNFTKKMDLKVVSAVPDFINTNVESLHSELYKMVHELVKEHQTTLIFTNTRSATERVVDHLKERYPGYYGENIGAHHGSLSAEHRTLLETRLREGKLKAVVCSTSLELGIDIGHIDLVITLGSPKSVARALQRIGRSGHSLVSVTKGRIIVLDRDDLVECSVLLKSAIEKKIDRLTIPKNSLDVLAQHIYGMAIADVWDEEELFNLIRQSYCYNTFKRSDFEELLSYLAGEFAKLEDRNVYAKIWRNNGKIGKKGKMARVIYMTNIGTIPDQTAVYVKIGTQVVGTIDEQFLEKLRPGDVFIL